MSDKTLEFLETEAKSAERQLLITTIIGIVAGGLAAGYLLWIASAIENIVQPSVVAEVATGMAVDAIPDVASDLKGKLLTAAPDLARTVTSEAIGALPSLRHKLEESLIQMSEDMARASAEDVGARFQRILAAQPKEGTPEEQIDRAVDALVKELEQEMNKPPQPAGKTDDPEKHGDIFVSFRQSADYLRQLNAKLRKLAERKGLTQEENAMRRLLTNWMGFLEQSTGK